MEQSFFLAKELNISWSDLENMEAKERNWLFDRLIKFREEENDEYEKELNRVNVKGGKGVPINAINT